MIPDPGRASKAVQIIAQDLTADGARSQRDQLAGRTDVLDKVKVLRTLPDDLHVTTDMVAEFFEVPVDTIRSTVNRNREEFDADGVVVLSRGEFDERFGLQLSSRANSFMLYPRRAVLRAGMLLRDSDIARQVRDYLLDVERAPVMDEDQIVRQAMLILDSRVQALTAEVAELKPKASLADDYLTAQGGARLVAQVAKTYGLKESDLRRFLIEDGLVFTRHAQCGQVQYDHYAQFAHHFLPRETVVQHQFGSCSHYTLYILPRGVELIGKRLRAKGLI